MRLFLNRNKAFVWIQINEVRQKLKGSDMSLILACTQNQKLGNFEKFSFASNFDGSYNQDLKIT